MQRSRRGRPWPVLLKPQSDTRTHERRRKPGDGSHWVQPPLFGVLNAASWRQKSQGPGEDRAPHVESPLLLPPIPFPLPTQAAKGRGAVSSTSTHLVLCPSFGRGDVLATRPSMPATTISRQCLVHQNDTPFRARGVEEECWL